MQITLTKKLVAALVNGFDVPGLSYLQKVDILAKALGYANQAALMSALPKGPAEPAAPVVPETPRVVWPEPTFVPTKSGSDLNPDRVPFLYGAIKQELVIGEIMRLVEMLSGDVPDDQEDEDTPAGVVVAASNAGQGKSRTLSDLVAAHIADADATVRVMSVDAPRELTGEVMTSAANVSDTPPAHDDPRSRIAVLDARLTRATELMEVLEGLMEAGDGAFIGALTGRERALAEKHEEFFRSGGVRTFRSAYENQMLIAQRTADRLRFLEPTARYLNRLFPGDTYGRR